MWHLNVSSSQIFVFCDPLNIKTRQGGGTEINFMDFFVSLVPKIQNFLSW